MAMDFQEVNKPRERVSIFLFPIPGETTWIQEISLEKLDANNSSLFFTFASHMDKRIKVFILQFSMTVILVYSVLSILFSGLDAPSIAC